MHNKLKGSEDVETVPVIIFTLKIIEKLVACVFVIWLSIFFALIFCFLPFLLIIEFANQQTEKAKITKTYESLVRRYYNNTLFYVK
jgi:hypothetical protein